MEQTASLRKADLLGALCSALDLVEGQPPGHCVRCCWIGVHIGLELGLRDDMLYDLYYTLLLKDLGCSSNAARISQLYLTDDLSFKRDAKVVDTQRISQVLTFIVDHTGINSGLAERFRTLFRVSTKFSVIRELIETRCNRGADISRRMRFSEMVAEGIRGLDEHWNGKGNPQRLKGEEIPLFSRVALLAQTVDVFHTVAGREAALKEVKARSGTWFDPMVVEAFEKVATAESFWMKLASKELQEEVLALEPAQNAVAVDEQYIDDIAGSFAQVIDAKSAYTKGHSERVLFYADLVAEELGISLPQRRWIRRAALLHDIGMLSVSNAIIDKAGKLDPNELKQTQAHALQTQAILEKLPQFRHLAAIAGAHHERLDGRGYPHGLSGHEIAHETRIITVADIYDALTADRPHRSALPPAAAIQLMSSMCGSAIDETCFQAFRKITQRLGPGASRRDLLKDTKAAAA